MRYRVWQTEIGNYGSFFALLPQPSPIKTGIRILKKKRKKLQEISSFYTSYQKPQSYEVQFLTFRVRHNFLSFWAIFWTFTPLTTCTIKILKKRKKVSVIILHLCTKNHDHIMYASWDMECGWHRLCHFGPFFALLLHYWPWKLKSGKNVKNTWR